MVGSDLLNWIFAFLCGRKQRVMIGSVSSSYCDVISGVPQGSVLGPLLFLLYVNDIVSCAEGDVKLRLFADDVKLYVCYVTNTTLGMSPYCEVL